MLDDAQLLHRYAEEGSEAAFAELVGRYLSLVYSAALRQVGGDAHRAQDVVQIVFVTLARKASSLARHPVLAGWLYTATHLAATKVMRTEWRRQAREQEAHKMSEIHSPEITEVDWTKLRPVLDRAMRELNDRDREAVLLRFFAHRPFAEIGTLLKVSEDAARMRVDRALEKLRSLLARRGVTSTSVALGVALANEASVAAPAGLISSVARAALAGVMPVQQGTTLVTKLITLVRLKAGAVFCVGAALLMATLVWTEFSSSGIKEAEISRTDAISNAGRRPPPMDSSVRSGPSKTPTAKNLGMQANPESKAAKELLEQGWKYEQAKQYDLAIEAYTSAIGLDPKIYDAYFNRAGIYSSRLPLDQRDYAKAVADYTRALEIDPRDVSARHNRALGYKQLRKIDEAFADFSTIIEGNVDFSHLADGHDKETALARQYRGKILRDDKHDYIAAIADFDEVVRLDPNAFHINYDRALAHQALKQYAAAEADFTAAFERDPDYPNLLASWAWQLATAPEAKWRDGEAALKFATRANEKFKFRVAEHLDVLAAAFAENGRFEDAAATERKALSSASGYQLKLKPAMQLRLQFYEAGKPFRDD